MYNYNPYGAYAPSQQNQYAFVNGIEGAKSYLMQPNQTVLLMDSDNPMCYMKTSNQLGQSTLRYFKLQEVTENDLKPKSVPAPDYVLKSDLDSILSRLDALEKEKNNG